MKINIGITVLWILSLTIKPCGGQPHVSEKTIEWGKDVYGVKLSLQITNAVIEIGATNNFQFVITNGSSKPISDTYERYSNGASDFDVVLTKGEKILYHLMPPVAIGSSTSSIIRSADSKSRTIPIVIRGDVPPGDYRIKGSCWVGTIEQHEVKIESNALEVHVKKKP